MDRPEFDKERLTRNFNCASAGYESISILQRHAGKELLDRLRPVQMKPSIVLDLGSGTGRLGRELADFYPAAEILQLDIAFDMLVEARKNTPDRGGRYICADAESLPIKRASADIIVSNLMLQWCEDPATTTSQVLETLRAGGLFAFATLGPDTLYELRDSWASVDGDVHVNTFIDMHDLGDVLVNAGYADPVIDSDRVIVEYDEVFDLLHDLGSLGASNVNRSRRKTLTGKDRLARMVRVYEGRRRNGKLPASYEVIFGHAWRPLTSQPRDANGEAIVSLEAFKSMLGRFKSGR